MSKKKKKGNRTEEARRGTKADSARVEKEDMLVKADGLPSWYVEPLDEENLTSKYKINRTLFKLTEILLCATVVIYIAAFFITLDEISFEYIAELIGNDPAYIVDFLCTCLQLFAVAIIHTAYKRYSKGDAACVTYMLGFVFGGELALLNVVGIICLAVLIWRTWKRCAAGYSNWRTDRGFKGVLFDLAPSIIFLVLVVVCYYLETELLL